MKILNSKGLLSSIFSYYSPEGQYSASQVFNILYTLSYTSKIYNIIQITKLLNIIYSWPNIF